MADRTAPSSKDRSPWPHAWAVFLACATFPLIWIGGLVTTTDAGMAFRDWLTSDGYFMPFYPWLSSAGDKFVEHGHRLFGMTAGILSIVLVIVTWCTEPRSWVRKFSLVILAGVILQGILGGMRILLDERTLALVHGCTGPLFFAMTVAMVVFTSKWWHTAQSTQDSVRTRKLLRLAVLCTVLAYLQLIVGAVVRHSPHLTSEVAAGLFQAAVYFHLLLALLIVGHVLLLAGRSYFAGTQAWGALAMSLLVGAQVVLGLSTWVVKYGVPRWASTYFGDMGFVNREADFLTNAIITTHVAVGSLILVTALAMAIRFARLAGVSMAGLTLVPSGNMEAAI